MTCNKDNQYRFEYNDNAIWTILRNTVFSILFKKSISNEETEKLILNKN